MSKGQQVLEALEAWIASWIAFPAVPSGEALIMALWCLHTYFAPRWPATAYVHVTSDGPGCGKTTLMEVCAALALNPRNRPTLRPLSVVRDIEEHANGVTYFFDQVEALGEARKISEEQAILLSGYKMGGEHGITVGQRQVSFSTYCAKMFASIGDIHRDLRSRSIVLRLGYGVPARSWTDSVMVRKGEAETLLRGAREVFDGNQPTWTPPEWLQGREREVWTPIYSVALAMGLDGATLRRVRRAADDLIEFKRTAETRSYRDLVAVPKDDRSEYAMRALTDIVAVLTPADKTHTGDIHTADAIDRMKALDGPWRVFKGTGLTADHLAQLLAPFGVEAGKEVRMIRGSKGRLRKGYSGKALREAFRLATTVRTDADE